jgi:hypothetical protein
MENWALASLPVSGSAIWQAFRLHFFTKECERQLIDASKVRGLWLLMLWYWQVLVVCNQERVKG